MNIELGKIQNMEDLHKAKIHLKYICENKEKELKGMLKDLPSNVVINVTAKTFNGILNNFFDKSIWKNEFTQSIFQVLKSTLFEKFGNVFTKKQEGQSEEEAEDEYAH